jgi:hypothetical protein
MKTSFEIWAEQLAERRGVESVPDTELARLLGIHRNRIADYKRGHSLHTPPKPAVLDLRTRLAMAAILAELTPWQDTIADVLQEVEE